MKRTILLILLILSIFLRVLPAQPPAGPRPLYDSLLNRIQFPGRSDVAWSALFRSFDSLVVRGDRTLHFLHLGDSHIQAGFLTETLNRSLTELLTPGCGSRGFLFPYRIARSNTPPFYSIRYSGTWQYCRIVGKDPCSDAGLAGYVATTTDTIADLHLKLKQGGMVYDFNRLRLFHSDDSGRFVISLPALAGHYQSESGQAGILTLVLDQYVDSLWIRIEKKDTLPGRYTLYGLEVQNGDPGIVFSTVGVNGADFGSFLTAPHFLTEIRAIRPDCIVISLGTNDAFALHFDEEQFRQTARELIRRIRMAAPGAPILLTTPPDCNKKRKYDNKTVGLVRKALMRVAAEEDCAVWDLYSIMGGPASMTTWYKAGLASRDKIHFTRAGYELQGELLFRAIREAWLNTINLNR